MVWLEKTASRLIYPVGLKEGNTMSGVAVTGATGFLGRRLVDNLVATGQSVRAMVRDRATANLPDGVELVEGDVLSSDAWRALLRPGEIGRAHV